MKQSIQLCCMSLVACFVVILTIGCSQQEASKEDPRLTPKITTINKQKMLVAEMKGAPEQNRRMAYSALFHMYYQMKKRIFLGNPSIRVRYPQSIETPFNDWIELYGLTIPETVETLPVRPKWSKYSHVNIRIEYWEYGNVGEILHIGPYTASPQSYDKLKTFIKKKGYKMTGSWEEEYIKTAAMGVSPSEYETMLRVLVIKKE